MSFVFFFKQKTAYEMLISDWSSDVCSSDLSQGPSRCARPARHLRRGGPDGRLRFRPRVEGTGPRLSRAGRGIRADVDRARLPDRAAPGVREFRLSCESGIGKGRRYDDDPDRKIDRKSVV